MGVSIYVVFAHVKNATPFIVESQVLTVMGVSRASWSLFNGFLHIVCEIAPRAGKGIGPFIWT